MISKILARGVLASGYLFVRFVWGMVLLAVAPLAMLLGWALPDATAGLVRLANSERQRASSYLELPDATPLPDALPRQLGDVKTLLKDRSFVRSLRLLLL